MIRLLVVSDIRLYRDGFADVLSRRPGLKVVGVAETPRKAIPDAQRRRPDIVLLDMATKPTRQAIRAFVRAIPDAKVVALAVGDSEQEVLECAEAGVAGFVTRASSLDELVATIENVSRGGLDLESGIQVAFAGGGRPYRTGDYWLIPARAATGDVRWPQTATGPLPRPPAGVRHHYAPLAVVTAGAITDCRRVIDPPILPQDG